MLEGELDQRVALTQSKLRGDVCAVVICAVVNAEFVGNLFAGLVIGDHLQDARM
jgi:hypothetical protein